MNYFGWEFSHEAQPELNKFLQVVNQNKNQDNKLEKRIAEIFPELKELQSDLENSKSLIECKDVSMVNNDVIMIVDDDNENMEIFKEIKTEIPDISLLNLSQAVIKHSEDDVLNSDVDVFIEYLLECLENENQILEAEYVNKLVNVYNNYSLHYLFTKLFDMSENGLYNLNKSICKHCDNPLKNIPELFCKIILFPKFQNTNPNKKMLLMMKEFCETFTEVTRQELIVLLLVPDSGDCKFFQTVISMLSDLEKQYLLRDFVYMVSEIELWHLSILESLLSSKIEDNVIRRLINIVEVNADKFKTEKLFIKLLITIINNLESGFEDQEQIIFNIIEKSKTANKISAQKALKKWASKFNEQEIL